MKANVLVAGGAGYIGSHIVQALLQSQEYQPIVFDNLSTGHVSSIPKNVKFIKGDVRDDVLLAQILKENNIIAVVHLCARSLVGESVKKPLEYFDNNVIGAISLLKAMEKANVKTIIFSSTAAVYGEPKKSPITEEDEKIPINPYGQSKLMIEQIIRTTQLSSISFRYFNVAGAGTNIGEMHDTETHLLPVAIKFALENKPLTVFGNDYPTRDGTCVRDYIHVLDLADAHVLGLKRALSNKNGTHEVYNLGTKCGMSVKEVVDEINKHITLNSNVTARREGDPATLIADATQADKVLGWKPTRTITDIVSSALNFHKSVEKDLRLSEK